jgi:hypothetical protein
MLEVADSYATDEKCLKYLQELAIDKNNHPTITLQSGILHLKNGIYRQIH